MLLGVGFPGRGDGDSSHVPARAVEARNKALAEGIAHVKSSRTAMVMSLVIVDLMGLTTIAAVDGSGPLR
jgi:hypothetical protein